VQIGGWLDGSQKTQQLISKLRAVSTTQAAEKVSAKNNDAQLIGRLVKLWATYKKRSLEVRRKIGSLLNARLGEPNERQRRDRSVVERAAEKLQISVSEINRMRWYAYFSKDEKSCWGEIPPGDRTWTKFKEILPDLIAAAKGKAKPTALEGDENLAASEANEKRNGSSGEKKNPAAFNGVLRSIDSVISKLYTDNFSVDGQSKETLIKRLKELAFAVSKTFGVRFNFETDQAGNHGLTQAEATPEHETSLTLSQCPLDAVAV